MTRCVRAAPHLAEIAARVLVLVVRMLDPVVPVVQMAAPKVGVVLMVRVLMVRAVMEMLPRLSVV